MITGQQIADNVMQYVGVVPYVYGGTTPAGWDCSGLEDWNLFHDLRMKRPVEAGVTVGRCVVMTFATWNATQPIDVSEIQAGDLCIWPGLGPLGHIGTAVSNTEMVSALNPTDGTVKTPIEGYGPQGVPLKPRRITSIKTTGASSCPTSAAKATATLAILLLTRPNAVTGGFSRRGSATGTRSR